MRKPLLLVVAGPPATGKTSLSRRLGDALALPVVCRDAIKEGVAHTTGCVVHSGTAEAAQLFDVFYEVVDKLLDRGVSHIAEAAFRADIAGSELAERQRRAELKLIRCVAPAEVWFERFRARGERPGHRDADFVARTLAAGGPDSAPYLIEVAGAPTLDVDTASDVPDIDDILRFVRE